MSVNLSCFMMFKSLASQMKLVGIMLRYIGTSKVKDYSIIL